jgi:hypothetical protein
MTTSWTVHDPMQIDVAGVRSLSVRLVEGAVDVVGHPDGDVHEPGSARVEVTAVNGAPLQVTLSDDGTLTVTHERLAWTGLLDWVRGPHRARATVAVSVPRSAAVRLGVVSADASVSGIEGRTTVRGVSGAVTLDGCAKVVHAETVSGSLETRGLEGHLRFVTLSGHLTVVDAGAATVVAKSVSGSVVLDHHEPPQAVEVTTVSGDVTVRLPARGRIDVDARSTSGHLESGFDGLATDRSPGSVRMHGVVEAGPGDGGHRVRARTVSGDVTLLARVEA